MDTLTQKPTQRELDTFVNNHVFACQSALIDELLKTEVFQYDDIENLYQFQSFEEWKENQSAHYLQNNDETQQLEDYQSREEEPHEIYEWYIVSDWLANQLKLNHEPILKNEFGTWWGRTTTGQAISLDQVIEDIYTNSK